MWRYAAMHWIAFLIGGFYLVGGLFALRQARMNLLLDQALSRISLKPTSQEDRIAGVWMFAASFLTIGSGLALIFLSRWAVIVFGLCWLSQAVYLLWASRTEDYGRPATVNAFILYTFASALVLWFWTRGVLG